MSLLQLNKNRLTISMQAIANLLLLGWLYNEYLHNVFLREYLANLWMTSGDIIMALVILSGVAVATIGYLTMRKAVAMSTISEKVTGDNTKLEPIDMCPVCNSSLRELSATRMQCRKCKRYFKK